MPPCNHKECSEHPDVIVATRVNKIIMLTFGTIGTAVICLLLGVATLSFSDLKEHKDNSLTQNAEMQRMITSNNEASLKRDTRTQVSLANISNHTTAVDSKIDSLNENIDDLKILLQNNSTLAENKNADSSFLLNFNY